MAYLYLVAVGNEFLQSAHLFIDPVPSPLQRLLGCNTVNKIAAWVESWDWSKWMQDDQCTDMWTLKQMDAGWSMHWRCELLTLSDKLWTSAVRLRFVLLVPDFLNTPGSSSRSWIEPVFYHENQRRYSQLVMQCISISYHLLTSSWLAEHSAWAWHFRFCWRHSSSLPAPLPEHTDDVATVASGAFLASVLWTGMVRPALSRPISWCRLTAGAMGAAAVDANGISFGCGGHAAALWSANAGALLGPLAVCTTVDSTRLLAVTLDALLSVPCVLCALSSVALARTAGREKSEKFITPSPPPLPLDRGSLAAASCGCGCGSARVVGTDRPPWLSLEGSLVVLVATGAFLLLVAPLWLEAGREARSVGGAAAAAAAAAAWSSEKKSEP